MPKQEQKKTSKARKLNHKAYPARDKHPDRVLRRIIQSSGFAEAERYAEKYSLIHVLGAIQKKQARANTGFFLDSVRWIERKKEDARRKADGFAPAGYHRGRELRRWEKFSAKNAENQA